MFDELPLEYETFMVAINSRLDPYFMDKIEYLLMAQGAHIRRRNRNNDLALDQISRLIILWLTLPMAEGKTTTIEKEIQASQQPSTTSMPTTTKEHKDPSTDQQFQQEFTSTRSWEMRLQKSTWKGSMPTMWEARPCGDTMLQQV